VRADGTAVAMTPPMMNDQAELQQDDNQAEGDLDALGMEARGVMGHALDRVRDQAAAHPLAAMGIAAGVGYVLGGGLPRFGAMFGLAAVGGVVGFGLPALLRGRGGETPFPEQDDESSPDAGESASSPTQSRSRRHKKRRKSEPASSGSGL
jgi:hypothetical protein